MHYISLHMRIVIHHRYILIEKRKYAYIAVIAARIVVALYGGYSRGAAHSSHGRIADGPESRPVGAVHLAHPCSAVQESVFIACGAEHANHHLGDIAVAGGSGGVDKIQGCIRRRSV